MQDPTTIIQRASEAFEAVSVVLVIVGTFMAAMYFARKGYRAGSSGGGYSKQTRSESKYLERWQNDLDRKKRGH